MQGIERAAGVRGVLVVAGLTVALAAGLAGCSGRPVVGDTDPIAVGDPAPGGCRPGTLSRATPDGGGACFAGGGCGEGQIPVRIDTAAGAMVACGRLDAASCGAQWPAGTGFVGGNLLCLAQQPPCAAPVNRTEQNDGVWTVVLDCTAG